MKQIIITLFTRTPLHVGAGNSVGIVDMPVQRERHTRIPIIPGSSLKGVFAELWNERVDGRILRSELGKKIFGEDDNEKDASSGSLAIGEARVLAFPVRSAKGMFAWITCPMALKRFARDTGFEIAELKNEIEEMDVYAPDNLVLKDGANSRVILEEYVLNRVSEVPTGILEILSSLQSRNMVWQEVSKRLAIINDSLFSHYVENSCEIVSRIKVDDEKGTVRKGGLFNQEQVPSETLLYSTAIDMQNNETDVLKEISEKLEASGNMMQFGGDASIGLGLCDVEVR